MVDAPKMYVGVAAWAVIAGAVCLTAPIAFVFTAESSNAAGSTRAFQPGDPKKVKHTRQAFAEFAVEEADDLAYSLQGKSFAAKLADDDDLGELIHRVTATMPLALRSNDAMTSTFLASVLSVSAARVVCARPIAGRLSAPPTARAEIAAR